MLDFVITGTGRCGTAYTTAVLQAAGIDAGHEEWFTVDAGRRRDGLAGDVSWLALPDLELGLHDGPVVHQVRDPLAVVRSLVGSRMFTDDEHHRYRWFAFAHQPGLEGGDDLVDAVTWYLEWNRRIDRLATLRVRVEDLDATLFEELCGHIGHPATREVLSTAIAEVGGPVNARPRADGIGWGDLPDTEQTEQLRQLASEYGYPTG